MTAHVNENCIGCKVCVGICPEVFSMTEKGTAKASGDISGEQEDSVREAADSCPVDAIELN